MISCVLYLLFSFKLLLRVPFLLSLLYYVPGGTDLLKTHMTNPLSQKKKKEFVPAMLHDGLH